LHDYSIFGGAAALERYAGRLAQGASECRQDPMQMLTDTRRIDTAEVIECFRPLSGWLSEQAKNRQCARE
jgi:hypothetical protein